MAQKFRTKIVEIEATQFTGDNHEEMYEWTEGHWDDDHDGVDLYGEAVPFRAYVYDILHGSWIGVAPGQWIVRGVKGEYYPCDNETFFWKYEPVDGN